MTAIRGVAGSARSLTHLGALAPVLAGALRLAILSGPWGLNHDD
jgi:hypothetical protein